MTQDSRFDSDGRAFSAPRIEIKTQYLHPEYELVVPPPGERVLGRNGHFPIFRVVHRAGSAPSFVARWDNAVDRESKRGPLMKVDLEGGSRKQRETFKHGRDGYAGHWPTPDADRIFHVDIRAHGEAVFSALVGLGVERGLHVGGEVRPGGDLFRRVIRGSQASSC